ncbi:serine protein kinase Sky1 [Colletotrichum asianum]
MAIIIDALKLGSKPIQSRFSRPSKSVSNARIIDEETISRYRPGGYHPVRLGDVFKNGKYRIIGKLGYGVCSTVWLASDMETKRHVALKILTADSFGKGKDTFELAIMKYMKGHVAEAPGRSHILGLLNSFGHTGPNGKHVCLVTKPMGPDLSILREEFPTPRLPVPLIKNISKQLLHALAYLHDQSGVIHTDIMSKNILIETPAINRMFDELPSEAFKPDLLPLAPSNDFYMQSEQVSWAQEDLKVSKDIPQAGPTTTYLTVLTIYPDAGKPHGE